MLAGVIAIPFLLRLDLLAMLLTSIDTPAQVLVIHNRLNSTDEGLAAELRQLVAKHKGAKLVDVGGNMGFAGAFNLAAVHAIKTRKPYLIFASSDTRFHEGALKAIDARMTLSPEKRDECAVSLVSGYANFAIKTSSAKRIGAMDENFWPAYSEDCDHDMRARAVGCNRMLQLKLADHGDPYNKPKGEESDQNLAAANNLAHVTTRQYIGRKWPQFAWGEYGCFPNLKVATGVEIVPYGDASKSPRYWLDADLPARKLYGYEGWFFCEPSDELKWWNKCRLKKAPATAEAFILERKLGRRMRGLRVLINI